MNVKVQDIMKQSVATCSIQDPLQSAAQKMWDHDCGCLPVVDPDGRALAMITDRDLCMAALTTGKPLGDLRVGHSMSKQVLTCRPQEDITSAAQRMAKHGVRRLPVVDGAGKLVGILSLNDLATAVAEDNAPRPGNTIAAETLRVLTAVCRHRSVVPATIAGTGAVTTNPTPAPPAKTTPVSKEASV